MVLELSAGGIMLLEVLAGGIMLLVVVAGGGAMGCSAGMDMLLLAPAGGAMVLDADEALSFWAPLPQAASKATAAPTRRVRVNFMLLSP